MAAGRVTEWKDKGYGFIAPDGGGKDVFFHASDRADGFAVATGVRVVYELQETHRGPRAVGVRRESAAPVPDPQECDVLSPDELWAELAPGIREVVTKVAVKHGWLEE